MICDFLDADLGGSQAGPEFAAILPSLTPRSPDDPQGTCFDADVLDACRAGPADDGGV